MIVVSLTDCPQKLRGDITKWLMEINTGVYIGNLNARVRDELWERICRNIGNGRATMVFSTTEEQKLGFYVHNTPWEVVDCDGISLIRRPLPGQFQSELPRHFSNAAHRQMKHQQRPKADKGYCAIDLETTGLSADCDTILEIGAVRVLNGTIQEEFQTLVASETPIPTNITELTGITEEDRIRSGIPLSEALTRFCAFVGDDLLVAHNAAFDTCFLRHAFQKCGIPVLHSHFADTLLLSKRRFPKLASHNLRSVAKQFGLPCEGKHRALEDSRLTATVYEKLNQL